MNVEQERSIHRWLVDQGLYGLKEEELLSGFCQQCLDAGLEVSRTVVLLDTLHPNFEGRAYSWRSDAPAATRVIEYGRTSEGEAAASWQRSPLFALAQSGESEQRIRIWQGDGQQYSVMAEFAQEGHTDYLAFVHRLRSGQQSSARWTASIRNGCRAIPTASATGRRGPAQSRAGIVPGDEMRRHVTGVEDAGRGLSRPRRRRGACSAAHRARRRRPDQRPCSGSPTYGAIHHASPIRRAPSEIIPLLNDYADAVISAIHEAGGDVLKLIGDGVLAIFRADDPVPAACRARAAGRMRSAIPRSCAERRRGRRGPADDLGLSRPARRARSSTATSAAVTASTSRSSARPSTRSAESRPCAARSIAACLCPPRFGRRSIWNCARSWCRWDALPCGGWGVLRTCLRPTQAL